MSQLVPVTDLQRAHHRNSRDGTIKTGLSMILLIVMAMYFLLPLYWLIVSSTKSTTELFTTPILQFPGHLNVWQNLKQLNTYQGGVYWRWFLNSMIYAGVSSILGTLISAAAGYAISRYTFRFQGVILRTIVAGLAIPLAALTIPIFLVLRDLGLINTYAGVILPMMINPFGAYFMSVYIRDAMPGELLDSGRVDGAGEFRIFWRIAVPIIRPGLVTLFLIIFIAVWNNFFLPLVIINNPNLFPITLGLNLLISNLHTAGAGTPMYEMIMLGSVISVLPMIILFPWLRRYITTGISLGSVKS
jgi:multiple sugar transport system permease protein